MLISRRSVIAALGTVSLVSLKTHAQSPYVEVSAEDVWSSPAGFYGLILAIEGTVRATIDLTQNSDAFISKTHLLLEIPGNGGSLWAIVGVSIGRPESLIGRALWTKGVLTRYVAPLPARFGSEEALIFDDAIFRSIDVDESQTTARNEITPTPTEASQPEIVSSTPFGETLQAEGWKVKVTDSFYVPDSQNIGFLCFLVVDLELENLAESPKTFDDGDVDFKTRNAEGWGGVFDIVRSVEYRAALEQYGGQMTKGYVYPYSLVFTVFKHDPNLYQQGFSGWYLEWMIRDLIYALDIGDPRDPDGVFS